jgi:hypothetical protein
MACGVGNFDSLRDDHFRDAEQQHLFVLLGVIFSERSAHR